MMTLDEITGTIEWLREYVHRMEDREDWEKLQEHIDRLKQTIQNLENRKARYQATGCDTD